MNKSLFAPHELLELHELLAGEATAAQKLQTSLNLVQDAQLKTLMQASLTAKQTRISQVEQILNGNSGTMQ